MSKLPVRNVYEQQQGLDSEADRLRKFDIPSRISLSAFGSVSTGMTVLDVGAGENAAIGEYVREHDAKYLAIDVRQTALKEQAALGSLALQSDARQLPLAGASVDIAHARFLLAHFAADERNKVVAEMFRTVKPTGQAVFIDYDWSAIQGSTAMEMLRDFTLENGGQFDAAYGSRSVQQIAANLGPAVSVAEKRHASPWLFDYAPVVGLRPVTLANLEAMNADQHTIDTAHRIFDELSAEAASKNPPGFRMPDIVEVRAVKP